MTLVLFEQLDLFQRSWGFRPPRQVWNHPGVDVAYEWGYLPFIAKELVPLCCFVECGSGAKDCKGRTSVWREEFGKINDFDS